MSSHKKVILLIISIVIFFITLLPAQESKNHAFVSIYELRGETIVYESNRTKTIFKDINITFSLLKSNDNSITIDTISHHDKTFKPIPKKELFQDTNTTYWIKVDFHHTFPSGTFICSYGDAKIIEDTFSATQQVEYIDIKGANYLKFTYDAKKDASIYYFKLKPRHFRIPSRYVGINSAKNFYTSIMEGFEIYLLLGSILGLILMAAIYNTAMYYYNKDISFLYYALMQIFMIALLYNYLGINIFDENSFFSRNIIYINLVGLGVSLFGTLFTVSFLEIKKYIPKLYIVFKVIIVLILLDMFISLFDKSYIFEFYLFPFLMLPFLYAGYKRFKQGYKPALFYLAGWIILTFAVFLNIFDIGNTFIPIDPLYIGSAIEAILFSLALSLKIRMIAREKEEQKELLVHQSKLASMGEMIGNIAHQWRQPLTHLSYTLMNIQEAQKHGELTKNYITDKVEEANIQLNFMSETINDFKEFYEPHKEKEDFSLTKTIQKSIEIMKYSFTQNNIQIQLKVESEREIYNYKNEFKQVLLNLLSNAKDALINNNPKKKKIILTIYENKITIEDNAGGIDKKILSRIFEPYFTTKENSSGIGLYMSKMIIEKNMLGELNIINHKDGVMCQIFL